MTRRGTRGLAVAAGWLLAAGTACAGSDIFGSLPGELGVSKLEPAVGETVVVTLVLHPASSVGHLQLAFEGRGCAVMEAASARREEVALVAGQDVRFATKARITTAGPCKIVASVAQVDESAAARTGWVYAVVLNEVPASPVKATPGRDASGHPTVDAVAH
jgi:hypothetical protein